MKKAISSMEIMPIDQSYPQQIVSFSQQIKTCYACVDSGTQWLFTIIWLLYKLIQKIRQQIGRMVVMANCTHCQLSLFCLLRIKTHFACINCCNDCTNFSCCSTNCSRDQAMNLHRIMSCKTIMPNSIHCKSSLFSLQIKTYQAALLEN